MCRANIKGETGGHQWNSKKAVNIAADDEHVYWKFNGEYWKDELGYYRFCVVNRREQARAERLCGASGSGKNAAYV